jgi:hypothetical protein
MLLQRNRCIDIDFQCSPGLWKVLKEGVASCSTGATSITKNKKLVGVLGNRVNRAYPITYVTKVEEVVASSLQTLISKCWLPTKFYIVALNVQQGTGFAGNGFRYIVFGEKGRILLRYDVVRQRGWMKAVTTTSMSQPPLHITVQPETDEVLGRDDALKVGDLVEEYTEANISSRRIYEVMEWSLEYIPCQKEYTDRHRSQFTSANPVITLQLRRFASDEEVVVVKGLVNLQKYRKVIHPFRGFVLLEQPQLVFSRWDARRQIYHGIFSGVLRAVVQTIEQSPPACWKALLLGYEQTYRKYVTQEVILEIESYCSCDDSEEHWVDKMLSTLYNYCPELVVVGEKRKGRQLL